MRNFKVSWGTTSCEQTHDLNVQLSANFSRHGKSWRWCEQRQNKKLYLGGFLKWWYPTTIGFATKHDHFGLFWVVPPFKEAPMLISIIFQPITTWLNDHGSPRMDSYKKKHQNNKTRHPTMTTPRLRCFAVSFPPGLENPPKYFPSAVRGYEISVWSARMICFPDLLGDVGEGSPPFLMVELWQIKLFAIGGVCFSVVPVDVGVLVGFFFELQQQLLWLSPWFHGPIFFLRCTWHEAAEGKTHLRETTSPNSKAGGHGVWQVATRSTWKFQGF